MARHEEYILGNARLHLQLSTAVAIMMQLICNASRPPSAQQLSESLGVSLRYLRKLLRVLAAGNLLGLLPGHADTWICTRLPHMMSLADIYHCLLKEEEKPAAGSPAAQTDGGTLAAELLVMQATMAINQIVLQHLQRFDLGRLKVAESAMLFTAALQEKALRKAEAAIPTRQPVSATVHLS